MSNVLPKREAWVEGLAFFVEGLQATSTNPSLEDAHPTQQDLPKPESAALEGAFEDLFREAGNCMRPLLPPNSLPPEGGSPKERVDDSAYGAKGTGPNPNPNTPSLASLLNVRFNRGSYVVARDPKYIPYKYIDPCRNQSLQWKQGRHPQLPCRQRARTRRASAWSRVYSLRGGLGFRV